MRVEGQKSDECRGISGEGQEECGQAVKERRFQVSVFRFQDAEHRVSGVEGKRGAMIRPSFLDAHPSSLDPRPSSPDTRNLKPSSDT